MSMRVHELAKRCGVSNKEIIEKLQSMNYPVRTHSSTVDKITADFLIKEYGHAPPPPASESSAAAVAAPTSETSPVVAEAATQPEASTPAISTAAAVVEPPSKPAPAAPPPPPVSHTPPATKPVAPISVHPESAPTVTVTTRTTPPATTTISPPRPSPISTATASARTQTSATATVTAPTQRVSVPQSRTITVPTARPAPPAPQPATGPSFTVDEHGNKVIHIRPPIVVRDLATRMGQRPHHLLAKLMELNVFATPNEAIREDVAQTLCERLGFKLEIERRGHAPAPRKPREADSATEVAAKPTPVHLVPRPPVVTFMGHVDHGKTSLLDAIRKTDVAAHESGGITQHIGASVVTTPDGRTITFLDTPGHEAFTKMRARGAQVTDIVVLVVAADDGVMPQTIEALNHAKAAGVTIMVAINKCDLSAANPDRVRKQLQEHGLTPEEWGGETIMCEVSAHTKKGIDHLLEMILLQADILELKADPKAPPAGYVIEAQLEPGRGPTATVLLKQGTLKVGQAVLCGPHGGKIRALINDKGQNVKEAGPAQPVKIVGLWGVPDAGAELTVVASEKEAREISEQRLAELRRGTPTAGPRFSLEDLLRSAETGEVKTLHLILKADVQGSLEAIHDALTKLSSDKVKLEVIHAAVGSITENDVLLASAARAVIIGFRVKLESGVSEVAKREGVEIRLYSIIYELLEQVEESLKGMLGPEVKETVLGQAEVRQVFELSKGPKVAGCYVTSGRLVRNGRVRVLRRRAVQYEGKIVSLRHFQDDVREVKAGMECGLRLDNFDAFQPGDILECFMVEKAPPKT
ncbi:MAG: translation initiation factor IF-2 [Verrucomicrobiae bacterium]|nr:translation initiation factor IF-2 [Verrucomicrobiae bacterium]MDW8344303.1 translation initiation factor IF-2 [Verrucomicrobiae bacterium]